MNINSSTPPPSASSSACAHKHRGLDQRHQHRRFKPKWPASARNRASGTTQLRAAAATTLEAFLASASSSKRRTSLSQCHRFLAPSNLRSERLMASRDGCLRRRSMALKSCPRLVETPKSTTSSISSKQVMPLIRASPRDMPPLWLGRIGHVRVDAIATSSIIMFRWVPESASRLLD